MTRLVSIRAATCAVSLGLVVVGCGGDSDDSDEGQSLSPSEVEFPTVSSDEANASTSFLEGDGAPLIVVHEVAGSFSEDPGPEECRTAGAKLDAQVRSDDALRLASSIDDEPLRAAFISERAALGALLASCLAEETPDLNERSEALRTAYELVEERLTEVRASG